MGEMQIEVGSDRNTITVDGQDVSVEIGSDDVGIVTVGENGPTGPVGATGAQGIQGIQGEKGDDGEVGSGTVSEVKRTAVNDVNYTVLNTDYIIGYTNLTQRR